MSGWRSVGYALELMFSPTGVTVELYAADEPHDAPIATQTGATADDAVRALFERVTLDVDDDEEN
jgi:hypothetical protein